MTLLLICCAEGAMPAAMNSAAYAAARQKALCAAVQAGKEKPLRCEDRPVYISSAPAARSYAGALCPGAVPTVREELDEAAPLPGLLPDTPLPHALRAFLDRPRGEERKTAAARAQALADELEKAGKSCVLFSHPAQLPLLMDALRRKGYCFARSGLGAVRPGERILATRRDVHCGGCQHNCMLSNPGCGIGRDKAQRAGVPCVMKTGEAHGTDKR